MTEWQRITWIFFHNIALNYNNEYQDKYITFFNTFRTLIPCKICRNHFIGQINLQNLSVENNVNSERIFNWTIDLHNNVNKSKNLRLWNYHESIVHYTQNNFNNHKMKHFLSEYIKHNFRKGPEKTNSLMTMMNTLPYFHPDPEKRQKLIEFKDKFALNRENFKSWYVTFLALLSK
jgi:sulfur relay (sulfurtransferase) DsrC/TusE family protein